ncbi:MAG TPA: amidase family protein [Polyangia bacterium]|nr:amidase family protein [Polyangia bacterium]
MEQTAPFDPDFGTAREALDALARGAIASSELTAHVFARIKRHNPQLNLFISLAEERAMALAKAADERRARRQRLGALDGLPIVVKDVFATEGLRTTAGSKKLEAFIPTEDAVVVARAKAAGAIVIGKTNLPEFAGDWQSYNQVAGTSNNPWDGARTPGGSTGGGAAALAAGLGFLEIGGDLSGSLRIPSHFCGVYGHKPTADLVPPRGHIPPPPGVVAPHSELGVVGPLARGADDLRLALDVIAGPDGPEAKALRCALPPPRRDSLAAYRLGYLIDDPYCPVDSGVGRVLSDALDSLRRSGAQLSEGWPAGVDPARQFETFGALLAAFMSQTVPDQEFQELRRGVEKGAGDPFATGMTVLHRDWLRYGGDRLRARAAWHDYFETHDAFLMPVTFVAAFPHDHTSDMSARRLITAEGSRPYQDLPRWTAFANLTGCPATVAPVGRTAGGLPVGIQIMGPLFEDATSIDIAARMAAVTGGFVAPRTLR